MSERFLANENFPAAVVTWLRGEGHDVVHVAVTHIGASDDELLRVAVNEKRILLTFDRDFGELVFHQKKPVSRGIVLFRLQEHRPHILLPFLRSFFASQPELDGFFTVASPGQFRQTPLHG